MTSTATPPDLPAVTCIAKLEVRPGDTLVVLIDRALSREHLASIQQYVRQTLATEAAVLVLDNGMSIGVLSAAEPDAQITLDADRLPPPPIGQPWAAQGGTYAGLARGVDGAPDHHLILAAPPPGTLLSWQAAMDWATQLQHGGHTDWSLPTRAESALLFANLGGDFAPTWHWTCEQRNADGAWLQSVEAGTQLYADKSFGGHARAVRRLAIQPFSPSTAG